MQYLIDTHAYLWTINDSPRLSHSARDAITNNDNQVFLSIASLWEIAIKVSIGKLRLDLPFIDVAVAIPAVNQMELLPITLRHLDIVSRLPLHHRDPFDRLLVAQSIAEDMTLLSNDDALDSYSIERLW